MRYWRNACVRDWLRNMTPEHVRQQCVHDRMLNAVHREPDVYDGQIRQLEIEIKQQLRSQLQRNQRLPQIPAGEPPGASTAPDARVRTSQTPSPGKHIPTEEQPAINRQDTVRMPAGGPLQLVMLSNDSPIQLAVRLAGPDAVIASSHLLQPVLKVRPLANAVAAFAADAPVTGSSVAVTFPPAPEDPVIPRVEVPLPPQLRMEAVRVTPSPVPAGAHMAVTLALFAFDQDVRETTIGVTRRYAIVKDGRELARFGPETFQPPNGAPSSVTMNTHAAKTPGDYLTRLEVEMGAHTAQAEAAFSIQ
jgi:hypothetical protein